MRLIALGVAVALFFNVAAIATDYKAGSIEITNSWSRATPKGASTAIGYMTIKNVGTTSDHLIDASVDVAAGVQLHSMILENGIAKMRELHDIEINPGQSIEFKPGGSHAMFVKLKRPLVKGEHIKGTLTFANAGTVQIEYDVGGIGDQRAPMAMDRMQQ